MVKRNGIKVIVSILVFGIFFVIISAILRGKSVEGIFDYTRKIDGFYEEPKESLDVVVIGSSNAFCNIGAMELWENFGIPAYLFANGNQTAEESLFYLQEVYKTQTPKVVMLEMHRFKDATDTETINPYFEWNMSGIPWSKEKVEFMNKIPKDDRWMAFLDIGVFHSRWKELSKLDFTYPFTAKERNIYKGSTVVFVSGGLDNVEGASIEDVSFDIRDGSVLTAENKDYLEKFISCAKEHGSEVVLFYAPVPWNYNLDLEDDVRKIGEKYDTELWAYGNPADYGLDYFDDYMDSGHMNLHGQEHFTQIIGERLVETFDLPDRREEPNWSYYEADYQKYLNEIQAAQQN